MNSDSTPIINRAIDALPAKDHAQKLLWVRLHKLSEKLDILTKLHVHQGLELREMSVEILNMKLNAVRKAHAAAIFWRSSLLLAAILALALLAGGFIHQIFKLGGGNTPSSPGTI